MELEDAVEFVHGSLAERSGNNVLLFITSPGLVALYAATSVAGAVTAGSSTCASPIIIR